MKSVSNSGANIGRRIRSAARPMLYPTGRLREALKQHPELQLDMFEALERTNPAQLRAEGRVYGGGPHQVAAIVSRRF